MIDLRPAEPSQQRWLEFTSTSNCTTFQARRLGIRSRGDDAPVGPGGRKVLEPGT